MAKNKFEPVQKSITKDGKKYNVGIGKDDKGYFAYTHRARTSSYDKKTDIPKSKLEFIKSTS